MPNDIYFKVGLITTIGLSAKNAILIVEVAREFYREGMNAAEAAVAAAKLRLRPILMTSLAFGAGVIPLAFAHGRRPERSAPWAPACWAASLRPRCWPSSWCPILPPDGRKEGAGSSGRNLRQDSRCGKFFVNAAEAGCRSALIFPVAKAAKRELLTGAFRIRCQSYYFSRKYIFSCRHGNRMVCINGNILMIK